MAKRIFMFEKGSKILGLEKGYYFGDEFLSRYKREALEKLRNRVEEAGKNVGDMSRTVWDKGKEVCPEEWEVIHAEWLKESEKIKKTHEKKKVYYDKMREEGFKRQIATLKVRIDFLEGKKKKIIMDLDQKKEEFLKQIRELEQRITQAQAQESTDTC